MVYNLKILLTCLVEIKNVYPYIVLLMTTKKSNQENIFIVPYLVQEAITFNKIIYLFTLKCTK